MKLNPDCVRDVMFALEDATQIRWSEYEGKNYLSFLGVNYMSFIKTERIRGTYSIEEVVYTLLQLAEDDSIKMPFTYDEKHFSLSLGNVMYITPKGHRLLSTISDDSTWAKKIRPAINAIGSVSLSVIETIAKGFATAQIDFLIQGRQGLL